MVNEEDRYMIIMCMVQAWIAKPIFTCHGSGEPIRL